MWMLQRKMAPRSLPETITRGRASSSWEVDRSFIMAERRFLMTWGSAAPRQTAILIYLMSIATPIWSNKARENGSNSQIRTRTSKISPLWTNKQFQFEPCSADWRMMLVLKARSSPKPSVKITKVTSSISAPGVISKLTKTRSATSISTESYPLPTIRKLPSSIAYLWSKKGWLVDLQLSILPKSKSYWRNIRTGSDKKTILLCLIIKSSWETCRANAMISWLKTRRRNNSMNRT